MSLDLNRCERNADGHWLCQTRDGRPARVVYVGIKGAKYSLLALVSTDADHERAQCFLPDGGFMEGLKEADSDLINLPRKVKRWVNVPPLYEDSVRMFINQDVAAEHKKNDQKTVEIEWEEP